MNQMHASGRIVVSAALGLATVLAVAGCGGGAANRSSGASALLGSHTSLIVEKIVPARGSVDVTVYFDGAPEAEVHVNSDTTGLSAGLGGVPLESYQGSHVSMLSRTFSHPIDGVLHIANLGSTQAIAGVVVKLQTSRYLTVTPSTTNVPQGGSLGIDVTLTEATDSDGLGAYLQDSTGAKTPITLTKLGTGHWMGQVAPTVGGASQLFVQTTGDRVRYDMSTIAVASGNVSFGTGFTERRSTPTTTVSPTRWN
jgi:hypothetical protein